MAHLSTCINDASVTGVEEDALQKEEEALLRKETEMKAIIEAARKTLEAKRSALRARACSNGAQHGKAETVRAANTSTSGIQHTIMMESVNSLGSESSQGEDWAEEEEGGAEGEEEVGWWEEGE